MLEDGIYYGVRVGGRLVSAAGTHVINTHEGSAWSATSCRSSSTVATTSPRSRPARSPPRLLTRVDDVALNVHTDNAPAIAAYQRLGFQAHCLLTERLAEATRGRLGNHATHTRGTATDVATRNEVRGDIADIGLADAGALKIEWADRQMPVLAGIAAFAPPSGRWRVGASAPACT